jgi:thioesterase domain-containing protein
VNASFYRPLSGGLGPDQPVFGLSIPEPTPSTPTAIAEIAAMYKGEIDRLHPEGPVSLAAVSLGGYVAFELAQQLVASGREVLVLGLFDAEGPGGRPRVGRAERVRTHGRLLRLDPRNYVVERADRVANRWRELLDRVRSRVHALAGRDAPEDLWLHEFVVANARAADAYRPEPYTGRIVVFRAAAEHFDAPECEVTGLGWAPVAAGPLEVVNVDGQHISMLEEPHVASLAGALDAAIARARGVD